MAKTPIILLNWNGFDDTVECVESVLKQSAQDFTIYLIDNHSSNNEYERLCEIYEDNDRIVLLKNESNLGFTLAHNQIFEQLLKTDAEYVALLNNDTVADPHWLRNALDKAQKERADMVASLMLNYYDRTTIDSAGLFLLSSGEILPTAHGLSVEELPHHKTTSVAVCGGACLYRLSLLREIGVFDPYFSTGYEDAELGFRAFIAGKNIQVAHDSVVYHKMSQSVSKVFDRRKAQKIKEDINYTYLKLMPAGAIFINAIINIPRWIVIMLVYLVSFRFKFLAIQLAADLKTIKELPVIIRQRRAFGKQRKRGTVVIMKAQTFFLCYDWKRFVRIILKRNKSQFEKYNR